jgi:REP element-mobilizing transposase RayT
MQIHAWMILDNHLHAIVAAPDLSRTMASLKRETRVQQWLSLQPPNCRAIAPVAGMGATPGNRSGRPTTGLDARCHPGGEVRD